MSIFLLTIVFVCFDFIPNEYDDSLHVIYIGIDNLGIIRILDVHSPKIIPVFKSRIYL